MALDLETKNELLEVVKQGVREVLAETGGGVVTPPNVHPNWAYGDALMSPPRADGAVQLKFVQTTLLDKYGPTIKYKEATVGGVMDRELPIPQWYFMPESQTTDIAKHAVGSAEFNQNRAFTLKTVVKNYIFGSRKFQEEDSQIMDAFASQHKYADLEKYLTHRAAQVGKSVYTLLDLKADEMNYG